jgi:tape measure domain-containing protein
MAATEQKFNIKVATQGTESLTTLKAKLANLGKEVNATKTGFQGAAAEIKKAQANSDQSVNSLRKFSSSWRELANSVSITSKEFRNYTREAERAERAAAKFSTTQGKGGRLSGAAKIAGTVAAGGVFGGPEGALGALGGAIIGGVPGAAVGAAFGAQLGQLRQQAAALSTFVAEVNKSRIALAGVSKDQQDYGKSIKDVTALSKDYLLPIGDATKQYTKLKASVVGAGLGTKETTAVFRGIAAAVVATGGSAEDLNAALRATSQVFSKGKVSAEELRQQIGERLPGAFTIFAQSLGKTPQELDKALEDGKVTLADFYTFTQELLKRYGSTAEILAKAPENAGARLKVALSVAGLTYAGFFQVIGAGFQNQATQLVEWALNNEVAIKRVVTVFAIGFNELSKVVTTFAKFLVGVFNAAFTLLLGNLNTVMQRVENAINRMKAVQKLTPERIEQFKKEAQDATNEKFGGPGGLFTFARAGEAEPYYNQYFDNLIDTATKSAGAEKYTNKIQNILFPDFKPSSFGSGVGTAVSTGGDGETKGGKAAANAAKRLAERTKKQLDAAFKLNVLANKNLDVQMSATDEEKLQAKLDKVAVERRLKFTELQKKALSQTERELLASAQLGTILTDNNKAEKAKQDLLSKQTQELYLQIGLADVLGKKFQAALGGAFGGDGTAGRFRTDLNLMPGLTGGELGAHYEELQTQFKDLISASNQVKTAAQSISTAFGETFKGLITGSMGAREALAGFFQSIANHFADMASQMIAKYIQMQIIGLAQQFLPAIGGIFGAGGAPNFSSAFGGSGGFQKFTPSSQFMPGVPSLVGNRAVGGPIAGSGAYLVGERGPELFMPGRSGTIVPGGGMGGANVTVNVDANGTSVQGDQAQAKQLGVAVSAAVQAELVKQQRPGGLLSGTRR